MTARPDDYPDWATSAASADPVSGQDNWIEPPASWQTDGWDYTEKPARNYDNWQKRYCGLWLRYLDENFIDTEKTQDICIRLGESHGDLAGWDLVSSTAGNFLLQSYAVDSEYHFDIASWPEDMTLNSIEVDWSGASCSPTIGLRLSAYRVVWPFSDGGGSAVALKSGDNWIEAASDGSVDQDTYTCDQNNENWAHEDHLLRINLIANDTAITDRVFGIRINCTFRGANNFFVPDNT